MPKKRKEEDEKIKKLIREGFKNVEIHEQTGASESYISKKRKEANQEGGGSSPPIFRLSEKSQRNLIIMQVAMGAKDVDSAIEKMYNDFVLINSKKIRFDPNNEKSISQVFNQLLKELDERVDIADLLERVKNNDAQRNVMLMNLGVDEITFFLYQLGSSKGYRGTIIDYLNDAVKRDYIDKGWRFGEYYNPKLKDFHQKIINPSGKEILLPLE